MRTPVIAATVILGTVMWGYTLLDEVRAMATTAQVGDVVAVVLSCSRGAGRG
jgi:hypothetical protein